MVIIKDKDMTIISKHFNAVNYGSVTLTIQNGILIRVEHQEAELTEAGLNKRGRKGGLHVEWNSEGEKEVGQGKLIYGLNEEVKIGVKQLVIKNDGGRKGRDGLG